MIDENRRADALIKLIEAVDWQEIPKGALASALTEYNRRMREANGGARDEVRDEELT